MSEQLIKAREEISIPEWFDVWKDSLWVKCSSYLDKVIENPIGHNFNFVYLRSGVNVFDVLYLDTNDRKIVCPYEGEGYSQAAEIFLAYAYSLGSDVRYISSLMMSEEQVKTWRRGKFCHFCSLAGADIQMNLNGVIRVYDYSSGEIAYLGDSFYDAREIFCTL